MPETEYELRKQLQALSLLVANLTTTADFRREQIENLRQDVEANNVSRHELWQEIAKLRKESGVLEREVARIQAGAYVLYLTLVVGGGAVGFVISTLLHWR